MSMALDDLLKEEGLDAAGIEDALAWARHRAAELVRDVDGDPELGPLLEGAQPLGATDGSRPVSSTQVPTRVATPTPLEEKRPLFNDLRGLQAAFLAEAEEEDDELPEVGAVLRAFQKGKGRAGSGPARGAATPAGKPKLTLPEPDESFSLDDARSEARTAAERTAQSVVPPAEPMEDVATGDDALTDRTDAQPRAALTSAAPGDAAATADEDAASEDTAAASRDDASDLASEDTAATSRDDASDLASEDTAAASRDDTAPAGSDDEADLASDDRSDADTTIPVAAAAGDAPAPTSDAPAPSEAASEAEHGLPAPPEADLDPLAGIDFDDLPGVDEDDEEDDHTHVDLPSPGRIIAAADGESRTTMIPTDRADMTLPSMQAPLAELGLGRSRLDGSPPGELTERALNPLLPVAETTGEVTVTVPNPVRGTSPETAVTDVPVTAKVDTPPEDEPADEATADEPAEEIELLDDEDLLLMEEEPEEEPEWKQALKSVEGKGGGEPDDA